MRDAHADESVNNFRDIVPFFQESTMQRANIISLMNQTSSLLAPWGERVAARLEAGEDSGLRLYRANGWVVLDYPSKPLSSSAEAREGTREARKLVSIARRLKAKMYQINTR